MDGGDMDAALELLDLRLPASRKLRCPAHEERDPSLHVYRDHYYCFSCTDNGDAFGLIALFTGVPVKRVLAEFGERDRFPVTKYKRHVRLADELDEAWHEACRSFFDELRGRCVGMPGWVLVRSVDYFDEWFAVFREDLYQGPGAIRDRLARFAAAVSNQDPSPII